MDSNKSTATLIIDDEKVTVAIIKAKLLAIYQPMRGEVKYLK